MENNSTLVFNETEYKFYKNGEVIVLSMNGYIVKYFTRDNEYDITIFRNCVELIEEYNNLNK